MKPYHRQRWKCRRRHAWDGTRNGASGQPICKKCRAIAKRARNERRAIERLRAGSLVPAPMDITSRSIVNRIMWETRRQRHGPTGFTPVGFAKIKQKQALTKCRRGHKFKPETTYLRPSGARECRLCMAIVKGRYVWRQTGLLTLRINILNAHPDRGGTSYKFREAKRRLDAALKVA